MRNSDSIALRHCRLQVHGWIKCSGFLDSISTDPQYIAHPYKIFQLSVQLCAEIMESLTFMCVFSLVWIILYAIIPTDFC